MTWVAAGVAVAGAVLNLSGARKGRKQAKRARAMETQRIRQQTAEEVRRRTGAFEQEKSAGLATAGASGFGGGPESGGYAKVLEEMQKEFTAEVDWMQQSAQAGIDVTGQAYKRAASVADYQMGGAVLGGVKDVGTAFKWWA